jgi:hypothetical protein
MSRYMALTGELSLFEYNISHRGDGRPIFVALERSSSALFFKDEK